MADMFGAPKLSATNLHDVKRQTSEARAEKAPLPSPPNPDEPWLIWCDTDYEADALKARCPTRSKSAARNPSTKKRKSSRRSRPAGKRTDRQAVDVRVRPRLVALRPHGLCRPLLQLRDLVSGRAPLLALRPEAHASSSSDRRRRRGEIGRVIDRKAGDHAKMKAPMREAMRARPAKPQSSKTPYNPTKRRGCTMDIRCLNSHPAKASGIQRRLRGRARADARREHRLSVYSPAVRLAVRLFGKRRRHGQFDR
jgi:hypothetical protein